MRIHRFAGLNGSYEFSVFQTQSHEDNFTKLQSKVDKIIGQSGGYSQYGTQNPPAGEGIVTMEYTLISETMQGMDALRDQIKAMEWWGEQRIFARPTNYPTDLERWCYATCIDVDAGEKDGKQTDLWQPVSIKWSVIDPFWYATSLDSAWMWGDGTIWGGGALWGGGGGAYSDTLSGSTPIDIVVNNPGTYPTFPVIVFSCGGGQSLTSATISRRVAGIDVETLQYLDVVNGGEKLEINTRSQSIRKDTVGVYNNLIRNRAHWLKLMPGNNDLRITFGGGGDAADVSIDFYLVYK